MTTSENTSQTPPPGCPKAGSAPLGGSDPRSGGAPDSPRRGEDAWGPQTPPPGRPKAGSAPLGGSDPRSGGAWGPHFTWPVRVYWEDTDAGGIVFYANYLKFFERARTEWLRALGIEQQRLREQVGGMFVVTATQVKYHRPARLDDMLWVTARVQEAGRASLTIEQAARLQTTAASGDEPLLCEGVIRIGWVDASTLRPQRIPSAILDALKG